MSMKKPDNWLHDPLNPFNLAGTAGFGIILLAGAYQLATAPPPTPEAMVFKWFMAVLFAAGGLVALALFVKTLRGGKP